jgi:hypothetical protein
MTNPAPGQQPGSLVGKRELNRRSEGAPGRVSDAVGFESPMTSLWQAGLLEAYLKSMSASVLSQAARSHHRSGPLVTHEPGPKIIGLLLSL